MQGIYLTESNDKIIIPYIDNIVQFFKGRTTIILGGSESGKTTIINELKEAWKNIGIVVQADYKNLEDVKNVVEHAVKLNVFRHTARSSGVFEKVFFQIADEKEIDEIKMTRGSFEQRKNSIGDMDPGAYQAEMLHIKHDIDSKCRAIFEKKVVGQGNIAPELIKKELLKISPENAEYLERQYMDDLKYEFPLLVFENFGPVSGKLPEYLKELLDKVRFTGATIVITAQTGKFLHPYIRRNGHAYIFTTSQEANAYFYTTTNGHDKKTKETYEKVVGRIFNQDFGLTTNRKLVFDRCKQDKFACYLANSPVDLKGKYLTT